MHIKQARGICFILGLLFLLLLPLIAIASSPIAGHRSERKVILIGGYDAPNILINPNALHTRSTELPGWQSIINYLTQDVGTTENALVRRIGLTQGDIFLFSYAPPQTGYDNNCETGVRYGCPRYQARDTCLTATYQRNQPLYCQVEPTAIVTATNYLTAILNAYPNAEFDIIAHSEGGIVATYWAATASPTLLQRVNSIITLDKSVARSGAF